MWILNLVFKVRVPPTANLSKFNFVYFWACELHLRIFNRASEWWWLTATKNTVKVKCFVFLITFRPTTRVNVGELLWKQKSHMIWKKLLVLVHTHNSRVGRVKPKTQPSLNRLKPHRKTHQSGENWVLLTSSKDF